MGSFTPFVALLAEIEDQDERQGKLYRLPHVVLFAILAIVSVLIPIGRSTASSMFNWLNCGMHSG